MTLFEAQFTAVPSATPCARTLRGSTSFCTTHTTGPQEQEKASVNRNMQATEHTDSAVDAAEPSGAASARPTSTATPVWHSAIAAPPHSSSARRPTPGRSISAMLISVPTTSSTALPTTRLVAALVASAPARSNRRAAK